MNSQKLAEALRALSLNAQFNGRATEADNFNDAAAACEEEDMDAWQEHMEGHGVLERKIAALEDWRRVFPDADSVTASAIEPTEWLAYPASDSGDEQCEKCPECYWKATLLDEPIRCHIEVCKCHVSLSD